MHSWKQGQYDTHSAYAYPGTEPESDNRNLEDEFAAKTRAEEDMVEVQTLQEILLEPNTSVAPAHPSTVWKESEQHERMRMQAIASVLYENELEGLGKFRSASNLSGRPRQTTNV